MERIKETVKNKKRLGVLAVVMILFGSLFLVKVQSHSQSELEVENLIVGAAASLKDVTRDLKDDFEKKYPHIQVDFTYGSSGSLQAQIEQGAPIDVFLSAAYKQMQRLEQKGFLEEEAKKLAENDLVLIVPKDSKLQIESFEECTKEEIQCIGVGEPTSVPVGMYAQEAFENLGIEKAIEAKCTYAMDTRQVLSWVEQGVVDCGVVYHTDALSSSGVEVKAVLEPGTIKGIGYYGAMIQRQEQSEAKQIFMDYLQSEEAGVFFEAYGFRR